MKAVEHSTPFFDLLDSPVCHQCGHPFGRQRDYWMLRRSKAWRPGPKMEGVTSHIVGAGLTCPRCDRTWLIQVLWVQKWAPYSPRPVPCEGLQILPGETAAQVMERMLAARKSGRRLTVEWKPEAVAMSEGAAAAARRNIAAIQKMMGD